METQLLTLETNNMSEKQGIWERSSEAMEKIKRGAAKTTRWAVLGASLLVAGCESKNSPEAEQPQKTEVLRLFDFENSFPVNKAEINPKSQEGIAKQVEEFLAQQDTPEEIARLAQSRITIEVSSDERATQTWEKGNEGLSSARLKELDALLRKILTTHKFPEEISSEEAEFIKNKTFIRRMPAGARVWGLHH